TDDAEQRDGPDRADPPGGACRLRIDVIDRARRHGSVRDRTRCVVVDLRAGRDARGEASGEVRGSRRLRSALRELAALTPAVGASVVGALLAPEREDPRVDLDAG